MDTTKQCPKCGLSVEGDEKFCPACGESLPADETAQMSSDDGRVFPDASEPEEPPKEERVFILRKKKYGDTEQFDDPDGTEDRKNAHSPAAKTDLSLYISIFAAVLAITAIVMVVIFAVIPANQRSEKASGEASETVATAAPTQPPTDPPIAGEYSLSSVKGDNVGLFPMLFKDSRIVMAGDYTGTLQFGKTGISEISLDKTNGTARFLDTDGTYTFDGNVLTIDCLGATFVFKKN